MILVPKISENSLVMGENINGLLDYLEGYIELQMISENFVESFKKCIDIVKYFKNIKNVVLHLPLSILNIETVVVNEDYRYDFLKLINESIKYSLKNDISITILFHMHSAYRDFERMGGLKFLNICCNLVKDTQVQFLVENSIVDYSINEELNVEFLLKAVNNDKLKMCLDLCHWQIGKNISGSYYDIKEILPFIYSIHFSSTLNNDGFLDKKKTHGRKHNSIEDCKSDLVLLQNKGIDFDKVLLVTEISEDSYKERNDLLQELKYLKEISI